MLKFLEPFDRDIQESLLAQIRDLWTHTSTALEGNSLTLGDTHFVLAEGLTVSGKPIKDHEEVIGHARAIDLIYSMLGREVIEEDIYALHRAVQTEKVSDIYKPYGAWKVEPNGTYTVDKHGKQQYIEYAKPNDVPALMLEFLDTLNAANQLKLNLNSAPKEYSKLHMGFVHIHPFWDGNGRMARLISNLPILNSGLPPIVIQRTERKKYIETLAAYQLGIRQLTPSGGLYPDESGLKEFEAFCQHSYSATQSLIERAKALQDKRS